MRWLIMALFGLSLVACTPAAQQGAGELRVGQVMPELRLVNRGGQPVSLSSLRGKPVLVNVWGVWCPPCRAELPALMNLQEQYRASGLTIIGVDFGDSRSKLEEYLRANPLNYEVWLEDAAQDTTNLRKVLRPWQNLDDGGIAVPYSIAITKAGVVGYVVLGYDPSGRELERLARAALK